MKSRFVMLLVIVSLVLSMIRTSHAQDPEDIGIDEDTFQQFFADAESIPDIGFTDVRDSINSFRIWFDPDLAETGFARAEITAEIQEDNHQLVLTFEDEPVLFNDEGQEFDREPGDGIFTASVPLHLPEFLAERLANARELPATIQSLAEFPQFRGREVVQDEGQAELIETLRGDNVITQRFNQMRDLRDQLQQMEPAAILDRLEIAPEQIPILEAIRRDTIFDLQLFEIPLMVFSSVLPSDVDPERSLMIRDVGVVEDPARTHDVCSTSASTGQGGPWTFAYLMRQMAQGSGLTPEQFTLQWLHTWILPQEANGILVFDAMSTARGARIKSRIIDPWIAASGGVPNIDLFPARLMSIVSRSDLANVVGYSQPGSGGEARFVFGLLEKTPSGCTALPFTVIFEYGIKVNGCFALKSWVQQWKDLDVHPVGSPFYNVALEAITRQFTDHGTNPSQLPNQNSLAQLRTNENALHQEWELREFTLEGPCSATPGFLDLVTVKQTPRFDLNSSSTLAAYVVSEAADILADRHTVPIRFPSIIDPFLDATARTPFNMTWDAPGVIGLPNGVDLRHKLALATCSGCHRVETGTLFTHIGSLGERSPGTPAALSGFLTGISAQDPVDSTVVRTFNDLARRQQRMADVLNNPCFSLPFAFPRLKMVH